MRRAILVLCLGMAALAAGCGGKTKAAESTAPSAPSLTSAVPSESVSVPTITSAADVAACSVLARNLRVVSQMTKVSQEVITNSLHPKDLAQHLTQAREVLLYAAKVMQLTDVPPSLLKARNQLASGLRTFAADFERARPFVLKKDMASAANEMNDGPALQKIAAGSRLIEKTCNA